LSINNNDNNELAKYYPLIVRYDDTIHKVLQHLFF